MKIAHQWLTTVYLGDAVGLDMGNSKLV